MLDHIKNYFLEPELKPILKIVAGARANSTWPRSPSGSGFEVSLASSSWKVWKFWHLIGKIMGEEFFISSLIIENVQHVSPCLPEGQEIREMLRSSRESWKDKKLFIHSFIDFSLCDEGIFLIYTQAQIGEEAWGLFPWKNLNIILTSERIFNIIIILVSPPPPTVCTMCFIRTYVPCAVFALMYNAFYTFS